MPDFHAILTDLAAGKHLSHAEAESAFEAIMTGGVSPVQISAFLTALQVRGISVDEIVGGATIMRRHADRINAPDTAVDTCGTGGTGLDTYNVSTASAFVTVAAGVPVAKHGNRAASSRSGSADVLEALGAKLDLSLSKVQQALDDTGFTFLFARAHHQAMRHVAPVRAELKFKTIFNLLGPLSSPALASRQILGVYSRDWVRPIAEVLKHLGSIHAWVVHGEDGLDEITTTGKTFVAELKNGDITEFTVDPETVGLEQSSLDQLRGGDPTHNAAAITDVMTGKPSPFRDIVLINAAASLIVAGKCSSLREGVEQASQLVDSGKAKAAMEQWIAFTKKAHDGGKK
jgi:anthranilate phosphoribosyltransferase